MNVKRFFNKFYSVKKPFELLYFDDGDLKCSQDFQTRHLAFAAGKNWRLLNDKYDYEIREKYNAT